MSSTTTSGARHRAARRPSTPLHLLVAPTARRGLVTVASSGLALTMAATAAAAAPSENAAALPQVDVSGVTSEALTAMVTTPTVQVPTDVTWAADVVATAEATPAPEPEPEPAPAPVAEAATQVRETAAASRTTERAPVQQAAPAAAPAPAPAPAASASGSAIVNIARQYVGVPYVYGGGTPAGFDCSGFTAYVFAQVGISLPRSSSAQRYAGTVVPASQAQPGDLVWAPGHVGIYTGNGNHIAARNPSTPLYESPIYMSNPVFIRVG